VNWLYGMSMPALDGAAKAGAGTMPPASAVASARPRTVARARKALGMGLLGKTVMKRAC
jgi:hypothetical protein